MKMFLMLLFVMFVFIIGCSSSSMTVRENQLGNGLKPLMENQSDEKRFDLSVPVYSF